LRASARVANIYQGAVTGKNPPSSQRLREIFYSYKPEIFKFYKSATHSKAGDVGNEKRVDDRANILEGGKIKSMIAAMIILPILAGFLVWRTVHGVGKMTDKQSVSQATYSTEHGPIDSKVVNELASIRAEQATGLLHGRKIAISAVANYGNGNEYRFKVKDGDGVARFDQVQLIMAGYKVEPLTDCMVRISGHQEVFYALCVEDQ
jgi:hypothetical protein